MLLSSSGAVIEQVSRQFDGSIVIRDCFGLLCGRFQHSIDSTGNVHLVEFVYNRCAFEEEDGDQLFGVLHFFDGTFLDGVVQDS